MENFIEKFEAAKKTYNKSAMTIQRKRNEGWKNKKLQEFDERIHSGKKALYEKMLKKYNKLDKFFNRMEKKYKKMDEALKQVKEKGLKVKKDIEEAKKRAEEFLPDFLVMNSAFQETIFAYKLHKKYVPTQNDPEILLKKIRSKVELLLNKVVGVYGSAKVLFNLIVLLSSKPDLSLQVADELYNYQKKNNAFNMSIKEQDILLKKLRKKVNDKYYRKPQSETIEFHCKTKATQLTKGNIETVVSELYKDVLKKFADAKTHGSTNNYIRTEQFEIHLGKWEPLKGSSYVPLPDKITNTKAVINPKNTKDNECFKWCIMMHDYPATKHPERVGWYKKYWKVDPYLDFTGINFPMKETDYRKFEKLNNRSINVYLCNDKGTKSPFYISEIDPYDNATDLLLYKGHYALIKDFNKLNFSITKNKDAKYFCKRCFSKFTCQERLDNHIPDCKNVDYTKVEMPNEIDKILKFKGYNKTMRVPFSIHCDFECLTEKVQGCQNENEKTTKYQRHQPSQVGMVLVSDHEDVKMEPYFYSGTDAHEKLLFKLQEIKPMIMKKLTANEPMNLTDEEEEEFKESTICHICEKKLCKLEKKELIAEKKKYFDKMGKLKKEINDLAEEMSNENDEEIFLEKKSEKIAKCIQLRNTKKKYRELKKILIDTTWKVRDHCHITGKYRGAAHNTCNLTFKVPDFIPVIFHNLRGYDAHFILQKAHDPKFGFKNIKPIPLNKEKFISFSLDEFRFVDSFQHMAASLESLIDNLRNAEGVEAFKITKTVFSEENIRLMTRKGVCPYDYLDDFEKFNETELPPREEFYSKLNETKLSKLDYRFAQTIWDKFNCETLKDYLELYLKVDVLCQADVFEAYRKVCMKNYGLDPLHYYTAPGLSWDALLKMTGVELELLTDIDMHLFFEAGKRGGQSFISNRFAKANNQYIEDWDKHIKKSFIAYWDSNNLYGKSMMQYLPVGGFRWEEDPESFTPEMISKIDKKSDRGYTLEVDLIYHESLHDRDNDYPLAIDKKVIKEKDLSTYNKEMLKENKLKHTECEKLVPSFENRTKYVIHYRNLQYYLSKGLILTKVHRVLSFDQKPWMRPYIEFNSQQRMKSKNSFEKDFYKLMNNSVFGKTMEDIRNHMRADIVTNMEKKDKLMKDPRLTSWTIWGDWGDCYGFFERSKVKIVLNKPIYTGFCVFDLSKLHMYKFHYDFILPKYGNKARLLFTDTDSLCYDIETEDLFQDMVDHKELFDCSDFPKNHKCYNEVNKKVPGKFKLETLDENVLEFVGLRSKLYSLLLENDVKKTCKGIKEIVKKNKIKHIDYRNCLFTGVNKNKIQRTLRSYNHEVFSIQTEKVALSAVNDKKYMIDYNFGYCYGHYAIKNLE